ncbi:hypothetical protein FLPS109957_11520 [Flavobacterium psychrophilum]
MKTKKQIRGTNSSNKILPTLFEKIAYPAKYLELRYGVSQFFIYLVFLFIIIGIFIGVENMFLRNL